MKFYSHSFVVYLLGIGYSANVMAATCPSGSTMVGANMAYTFTQPNNGKCEMPGYNLTTIPDELSAIYNGTLVGTAIKVCPNGYLNGSSCTDYAQGHCESGYYDMAGVGASAVSERVGNTCVVGGYAVRELPNSVYAIYNGFTAGSTTTLCGADAYRNGSSCTPLTGTDCPTNYKKIPLASSILSAVSNTGSCSSEKTPFSFNQSCDSTPTDSLCVQVCNSGLKYTAVGTCASLCANGTTELRTSTGVSLPIYSTKETTPALNIDTGAGICYTNLLPGSTSESTLMLYNGETTYHAVE